MQGEGGSSPLANRAIDQRDGWMGCLLSGHLITVGSSLKQSNLNVGMDGWTGSLTIRAPLSGARKLNLLSKHKSKGVTTEEVDANRVGWKIAA